MRSAFAVFLRGFVLPFGATGQRMFFDGDNGRIDIFNNANQLIGRFGPFAGGTTVLAQDPGGARAILTATPGSSQLILDPPDWAGHVIVTGTIQGDIDTGTGQPFIVIGSPKVDGGTDARIFVFGEPAGGGVPTVYIDAGTGPADLQLNGRSMPRGLLLNGRFRTTATDDVARAAGVNTDMAVTVDVIAGRAYEVTLNSHFTVGTAGANYGVDLWDGAATVGRFERRNPADTPAGSLLHYAGNTVDYFPTVTGTVTLTVRNTAGSGGTITMQRSTPGYRSLTIKDAGPV